MRTPCNNLKNNWYEALRFSLCEDGLIHYIYSKFHQWPLLCRLSVRIFCFVLFQWNVVVVYLQRIKLRIFFCLYKFQANDLSMCLVSLGRWVSGDCFLLIINSKLCSLARYISNENTFSAHQMTGILINLTCPTHNNLFEKYKIISPKNAKKSTQILINIYFGFEITKT